MPLIRCIVMFLTGSASAIVAGPVPPIIESHLEPTGKTICFRGISVYDIADGLIKRETTYIDLGTLLVELGIRL